MNRVRALLLTAYLVMVIVGGVIYVQSVSNMILYTEADQQFPSGLHVEEILIPRYVGVQDYSIKCNFSFVNSARAPIRLRAFSFDMAIDNGSQGYMYDETRLLAERIGGAADSLGDAGPLIDPGEALTQSFAMLVKATDSYMLNHLNANGNYTVIIYGMAVSYGYVATSLNRQFWPGIITVEVVPLD